MVKYLDDVLSEEDTAKVEEWQSQINDLNSIVIIEVPEHIECFIGAKGIETRSFFSLRNIYAIALEIERRKYGNRLVENPYLIERLKKTKEQLLERRKKHLDCIGRRHQILCDEMHIRSEDIGIHKEIIKEEEDYDFGLFIFPHWLKYVAEDFYELSAIQNEILGLDDFCRWDGLEKAIHVMWPTNGEQGYCTFVRKSDICTEEVVAQQAGGIARDDESGSFYEKANTAREQLERLEESEHFVVLDM